MEEVDIRDVKMHRVVILGESMVQACERTWNNFCRLCQSEVGVGEPPVLPFRPSVGTPAGWSAVKCEEV